MGPDLIPVKLTLPEICAAALLNAAEELAAATDLPKFVTALDGNYRLWQTLVNVAPLNGWDFPTFQDASYVFTTSCRQGAGVSDGDIDALVEINHRGAHEFAPRADRFGVLNRARLACAEGAAHRVGQWLLSQIERRSHVALTMAHRR